MLVYTRNSNLHLLVNSKFNGHKCRGMIKCWYEPRDEEDVNLLRIMQTILKHRRKISYFDFHYSSILIFQLSFYIFYIFHIMRNDPILRLREN